MQTAPNRAELRDKRAISFVSNLIWANILVLTTEEKTHDDQDTLMAALLALSPTLAFAYECNWGKHEETTAMSCAEGTVIDEETGTCVPVVTG